MNDNDKGKNTIMKMLLSSAPVSSTSPQLPKAFAKTKTSPSKQENSTEKGEEFRLRLKRYFQRLAKQGDPDDVIEFILEDHCYSKSWNSRPDRSFMNPVKTLFTPKHTPSFSAAIAAPGECSDGEEMIDVESEVPLLNPPFDATEADLLADECERHVGSIRADNGVDDWEDRVSRIGWSPAQNRLFNKVVRALHADRLNRLAVSPVAGSEKKISRPLSRRLAVDRAARRVRQAFSSASWDFKLITWLHATLMECLNGTYLAAYLDTLRTKIPSLIDKMISATKTANTNSEALELLLKRPWDPLSLQLNWTLPQSKLPGNPVLVVVPSGPVRKPVDKPSKRKLSWLQHLSALAKVVTVPAPPSKNEKGEKLTFGQYLTLMASTTRVKLRELRSVNVGSPIFLIGWGQGALFACQISMVEPVAGVVCLGFPMFTAEGNRGEPDDSLLDVHCPIFFVIGQNAASVSVDDVEDLRERMHIQTNLLVIGGADDLLRVPKAKMKLDGVTQSIIDRCIMDEVGDFIGGILTKPSSVPSTTLHHSPSNAVLRSVTPVLPPSVALVEVGGGANRRTNPNSGTRERRKRMTIPVVGDNGEETLSFSSPAAKRPRLGHLSNSGGAIQRRKPRSQPTQKMMLAPMNFQTKDKWTGSQFIASRSGVATNTQAGITVNIGSLASLAPLGPLKLSQVEGISGEGASTIDMGAEEGDRKTGTITSVRSGTVTSVTHTNTLTTLSSLLQQHSANGMPKSVRVSTAPPASVSPCVPNATNRILPSTTQIKVVSSSEDRSQPPTARIISGRTVDLSKLAFLTGGTGGSGTKGIVMLTDSMRGSGGGGPMLVPISSTGGVSASSPIAILPLATSRDSTSGGVTLSSHQGRRTLAMVPRITVSSVKMATPPIREALPTSLPTLADDSQPFNPESILELPIIFAKDGEDPATIAGSVTPVGQLPDGSLAVSNNSALSKSSSQQNSNLDQCLRGNEEGSVELQEPVEGQMDMGGMGIMKVVPSSDTGEESEEDGPIRILVGGSPRGRRGRRPFTPAVLGGTRTRRIRQPKHFTM
ncbi:hypothetical protein J437_LFUL006906 [Ladona fulva]|uniref:KAT8 regulatory NSL complex subunit 3 n=1 Tax=Ladona fulva TaxID=123851 RepID=A0A8K0K1D0_LADFU|nr:hypothetical protein J437_LFUL006906 [Ladona fulva]